MTAGMTTCRDCSGAIGKNAKVCPHCGAEGPRNVSAAGILFLALVGFVSVLIGAAHWGSTIR